MAADRPGNYRRPPAAGVLTSTGERQAICAFDEETFREIRALAEGSKISFRAAVRLLVEFGLEDIKLSASEPAE